MADLLGSILGSMEKPPSLGDEERKKARAQKKLLEKQQEEEKKKLAEFRVKIQKKIHEFVKDGNQQKYKFETMDKVYRAIVHEVADVAGLTSFSFGHEEEDRYVMLWKKEFAPTDEELLAYRRGEDWDPEKAKEVAKQKQQEQTLAAAAGASKHKDITPVGNYRDKYRHLIGDDVVTKDDAKETVANRSYGFVSADNKRDRRTIEQVLADTRAKKRMRTDIEASTQGEVTSFADQGAAESEETSP